VAFLSTRVLQDIQVVRLFPVGLLPVQKGDDPPGPEGPPTINQMGRPALAVTIRAANRDLTVVNCHLKSKLLSFPPGPSGETRFSPRDENERARYAAYALYRAHERGDDAAYLPHRPDDQSTARRAFRAVR
jgi:hypothetical protein